MSIRTISFAVLVTLCIGLFTACKDDDEDLTLSLRFEHKFGAEDAVYGNTYMVNGTAVQFDLGIFYCSVFTPKSSSGDAFTSFTDEFLLVRAEESAAYEVGTFSGGDVRKLGFSIGVDSEINHGDPANWQSPHPLASQSPSMYWGWDNGYIFFKFEGRVDRDNDGVPDAIMLYHIGKDQFFTSTEIDIQENPVDGVLTAVVTVDYAKLFENIDILEDRVSHTGDNLQLAADLVENWPRMFN